MSVIASPQGPRPWYDSLGMHRKRGFTLIEVLVVVAIIGILSSIVLASMSGARSKGRDAKRIADVKQMQLALQLYYDGYGYYPTAIGALTTDNYISSIPADPTSGWSYVYTRLPANCNNTSSICVDYVETAQLENVNTTLGGYTGTTPTFSINLLGTTNCSNTTLYCVKP